MPTNVTYEYSAAEKRYLAAITIEDKIKALQDMLAAVPKHKGTEHLRSELRARLAKFKKQQIKQKARRSGYSLSIKKEGAAQICLIGTNMEKSILLRQLTNAKPQLFYKPQIGTMDYYGIKLQIVEIPIITKNFSETELGPTLLSIINQADLMILFFDNKEEYELLQKELKDIKTPFIIYNNQKNLPDLIWKRLNLIKVYTKQPGKKPTYPPIALHSGATVRDLASHIHKDFIKKFRFARIQGSSVKFNNAQAGLNHKLKDNDIVEVHLK